MGIVFLLYDGYKLNIIILVDLFDIEILIIFIGDKFIEKQGVFNISLIDEFLNLLGWF